MKTKIASIFFIILYSLSSYAVSCKNLLETHQINNKSLQLLAETIVHEVAEIPLNQVEVFALYLQNYFGLKGKRLKDQKALSRIGKFFKFLSENGESLIKLQTPSQTISVAKTTFVLTPEFINVTKGVVSATKKLANNLFRVNDNLGYWMHLLKTSEGEYLSWKADNETFREYLNKHFSENLLNSLAYLSDPTESNNTLVELYASLTSLRTDILSKDSDVSKVSLLMVDMFTLIAYQRDPALSYLIQSSLPNLKLEGLRKLILARDDLINRITRGSYKSLITTLNSDESRLRYYAVEKALNIFNEENIVESVFEQDPESLLVRQLTLQESPFRSLLTYEHNGGCCATNSYFYKALDPNYLYFTMTNQGLQSFGHVTVVLGRAWGLLGPTKIAFLDKVQNVPDHMLIPMLTAVRTSLKSKGYKLGIPQYLGKGNYSISNSSQTVSFIREEVMPSFTNRVFYRFKPHKHDRFSGESFEISFSRAGHSLNLTEFQ